MSLSDLLVPTLALSAFLLCWRRLRRRTSIGKQLPGPPGWPVIRNLLDMRGDKIWLKLAKWGEEYGGILGITVAGQNMVIVNDPTVATALLDAKGTVYADRPYMPFTALCGYDRVVTFAPWGPHFRETRKIIGRVIGTKKSMVKFHTAEEYQASMFLKRLFKHPKDVLQAIKKTTGAMVLDITYGYKVDEEKPDPMVELADLGMSHFSDAVLPGRWFVDALPWLRYIPGLQFRRTAAWYRSICDKFADVPFEYTRTQMAKGTARASYTADLINGEIGKKESLTEERLNDFKFSALSIFGGGSDTTVSVIYAYFLAMCLYPDVQRKAQAEMDAIIGKDRLPRFNDRAELPYLEAVCQELYRWMPIVPLCPPHRSLADDVYNGYFIPAGSLIIANIWKFLHDEEVYKDPFVFNPERFLGETPEPDPTKYVFGFGRRICPGIHLADSSVWMNIAMSIAGITVTKSLDANGNTIHPVLDTSGGLIVRPKEFECDVKPRHDAILGMVERATQ